ncbi:hypothetical protein C8N24_4097 [Solirubrobacter pauli]|uniref:Uncharacterized protein n=1 Tax=Solirubrobacter pauli TaxID=166793 RepID=A0A660KY51_9ACTN|nr:hypothetical protein [Solirubrobacter pauli]RKQ86088.1 hypothetical protein C8N24_4097 [Solirubrobacter pauli]
MNAFFSAAADAALAVAVALLVLGAIARGVLWAQLDDPRWQRLARQYLEPLSTWSVAGFIVYALTLVAAGEAATAPLAIALVLAVGAAVLRVEGEAEPRVAPANATAEGDGLAPGGRGVTTTAGDGFAARDASSVPAGHLWDGEAEPAAPGGLWAREAR